MKLHRLGVQTVFWQKAEPIEIRRHGRGVADVAQDIASPLVGIEYNDMGSFLHVVVEGLSSRGRFASIIFLANALARSLSSALGCPVI